MKNIETKQDKVGEGVPANNEKIFASEINSISTELENAVVASGTSLDESNNYQLARSITDHALGGRCSVDTGTVNNYILSITGSRYAPTTLVAGYVLEFFTGNANTTTTPTLNYATIGVKTIVAENGTDAIVAGDIKVGVYNEVVYDGTNWRLILSKVNSASETVAGKIKISTTAQVTAGEDDTSAMTPAKFKAYLNGVKEVSVTVSGAGTNATGYTIFKDITTGAIVRQVVWGRYNTITSDNGRNIIFPLTFTTIHSALVSIVQNGGNTDASPDSPSHIRDLSLTGARLCNADALQTIDVSIQITGV